jgi:hypothetical protein
MLNLGLGDFGFERNTAKNRGYIDVEHCEVNICFIARCNMKRLKRMNFTWSMVCIVIKMLFKNLNLN